MNTKIIPLGGLGEVGKNMYTVMHGDEIIIVDSGVMFPDDDLLGIDYVIPDYTFLKENESKIKALIITHGHEDHIGSIPFLLQSVTIPKIYAPANAKELIDKKLDERNIVYKDMVVYDEDTVIKTKYFNFSTFLAPASSSIINADKYMPTYGVNAVQIESKIDEITIWGYFL